MMTKTPQLAIFKDKCCGCNACEIVCRKKAIIMLEDKYGFRYPKIDGTKCINCGSCTRICCMINDSNLFKPIEVYAATYKNKDILSNSTSGGIFAAIAEEILANNGIVFGTSYDENFDVNVDAIESIKELRKLQGSKYVQSKMGDCYLKIKTNLLNNRPVLFCGVPCQVKALRNYLGKDYENLILVDIVCHGVPSNQMLKDYLYYLSKKNNINIKGIQFRTKGKNVKRNGKILYTKNQCEGKTKVKQKTLVSYKSSYYQLFLDCYTYRDSCYHCKFAGIERAGDISICDYWGIDEEHPGFIKKIKKEGLVGVSGVMLNTITGQKIFEKIKHGFILEKSNIEQLSKHNPQLQHPSIEKQERMQILNKYSEYGYKAVDDFYYKKYKLKILRSSLGQIIPTSLKKQILKILRRQK